jgi:5-methyltetrahydrofolate--homocysteine methyltransferase
VQIAATDGLRQAVLRGDGGSMPGWIDAIVAEGTEPSAIVDSMLAPIMTELGDAFARGEAFLPQMMLAANSMKAAVAHIKTLLPQAQAETAAGRVLFCTVKGDVHSIGKDICVALLESQDFKVYDLGVDVAPETVLEQARALDIDVVCLSALMTTTLPAMKQTVELLYREVPAYKEGAGKAVMVGGAVVNERWAASIDAIYSPSAPDCVQRIRAITAKGEV